MKKKIIPNKPKSALVASILQQLPPDKVCQMEGNLKLREYVTEIIRVSYEKHYTQKEIVEILRKELMLLHGEYCWTNYNAA